MKLTEELISRWKTFRTLEDQGCEQLCDIAKALRRLGLDEVRISYAGRNGSGTLESVTALDEGKTVELGDELLQTLRTAAKLLLCGVWSQPEKVWGELVVDPQERMVTCYSQQDDYDETSGSSWDF